MLRYSSIFPWIMIGLSAKIETRKRSETSNIEYVDIYSFCDPTPNSPIHKDNGLYYIKPLEEGPVIAAICSNGYTMIDPSLDTNLDHIPSYLSSWDYSRLSLDSIITNLDDTSTFREWWLPSTSDTKFRVALQCKSCFTSKDIALDNNVVYYTDGSQFCYTTYNDGDPCLANVNEYACNQCDVGDFVHNDLSSYWSSCTALQVSPDTPSWHEPQMRVNKHLIYRPVMSMTRSACSCYQIASSKPLKYSVPITQLPKVTAIKRSGTPSVIDTASYIDPFIQFEDDDDDDNDIEVDCGNNMHYLSQKDFLYGTYRIRECGEYVFTEDILCNFNAPSTEEEEADDFSPNRIDGDRLYWYPTQEQSLSEYPGLYTYSGSYSLGFFAGITIETDDVIINLNGFTFEMDRRFYIQQRFFSLIELAAKPFLPHQGASTWGVTDVYYASNVEIVGPGRIGRSSHHGIHGNNAYNVYIHDIQVNGFDVAGIHCNSCNFVSIENVQIGPQNNNIPTLGRYTHSRAFIPRLKDLNDDYGDEEIAFYGRSATTVHNLCIRMIQQMDMIYASYVFGTQYDDDNTEWIAAKKLYFNDNGWMDGGSSYGIVINGGGAAVVGIGTRVSDTSNIEINNVEIGGIYNDNREKMKFSLRSGTSRGILFDVMDWISVTDQIDDRYNTQYVGDVYTDIQFAANKFITSWYYRNSEYIGAEEQEFVFNGNTAENNYVFLTILPILTDDKPTIGGCGTDIQLHSPKGSIGLMVNGAMDSTFNNIYIHDIYNWSPLGITLCGPYNGPKLTTEDIDISYGYTATRSHGMVIDYTSGFYTNIEIKNVESYYGEANGLTIYKQSDISISNIVVSNIAAGTKLDDESVHDLSLPNLIPRACPVDVHDDTIITYIDGGRIIDNVQFDDVKGFQICNDFIMDDDDNQISIILTALTFAVSAFLLYFMWRLMHYLRFSKSEIKTEYVSLNEKTPLLDTI